MTELKKTGARSVIDYMARDYDSFLESMRVLAPDLLPEWSEHRAESDFGNVLLQLFAHMGDMLSYYQDRIANESFLGTAQTRRSVIEHLRLIGYRLATAAPAAAALELSFPAAATGLVTVEHGFAFATKSQKARPSVRFEYLGPAFVVDCDALPVDATTGRKIHPSALSVEEGRSIREELLGVSDGRANQRFRLAHAGLILRSMGVAASMNRDLVVRTELGAVIREWTLQETLAFSRAGQTDFAIESDADDRAEVVFGDGAFGEIPPAGSSVRVDYRVGGGTRGNLAAQSITSLVEAPALALAGAQVRNLSAATGGAERESIPHAVAHAPQVFRSLRRAVTAADYEALALQFKGVGKVRAVAASWNTVNLFVAPEGGGNVSDVLRANLLAYFEDKRPISTVIEVEDVDYVEVYVAAAVEIESYYRRTELEQKIKRAAGGLLSFENVKFHQELYLSKFYEAIENIEGVKFVTIGDFRRAERPATLVEPSGKIQMGENEIAKAPGGPADQDYASGIKLEISGGF